MAKRLVREEVAGIENGRDITRGYFTDALEPEDSILQTKGAGDYKIYEEMLRDDQVHSTLQQRRMAITSREWDVEPGGSTAQDKAAAEFIKEQLARLDWDDITDKMHYGVYYGFAVAECLWARDGRFVVPEEIRVRKQRRFRWGANDQLLLITAETPQGEPMPDRKFWTFATGGDNSDNPYGLGLAHNIYWPCFFKRNGLKFWLIFLEKFGLPTVKGQYPGGWDDTKRKELLDALRSIQKDAAFIVPEGTVVDLVEAARSGTADYETLQARMDASIAKVVLSQVMTSEAVGGQYKAEVQKDVRDEVVKGDADLLHKSAASTWVRWLTEWNFPGAATPQIWRNLEDDPDLTVQAERDNKIMALGYEPTEDYIKETYGEGWVKKAPQEPDAGLLPPGTTPPPEFAEGAGILLDKMAQRGDQARIVEAARTFANNYQEYIGPRLDQILAYADETGDLVTFRNRLNELLEETPIEAAVREVRKATTMSRLMGMFKGQR